MKDEIKYKLDEHIEYLLSKPTLTTEEYELLKTKLHELPQDNFNNLLWLPLLMMVFSGMGGERNGL